MKIEKEVLKNKQYKNATGYQNRVALFDYSDEKFNVWEWTAKHYDFKNVKNILEVGCGTGDFWKHAANKLSKDHQLLLTDFSEGMLETTRKNFQTIKMPCEINFQMEDVENLSFIEKNFDAVIAHLMLYHANSQRKALTEIQRVLRPQGWFIATTLSLRTCKEIYAVAHEIDERIPSYTLVAEPFTEDKADSLLPEFFSEIKKDTKTIEVKIPISEPLVNFMRTHFLAQQYNLTEDFFCEFEKKIEKIIQEQGVFKTTYDFVFYQCSESIPSKAG